MRMIAGTGVVATQEIPAMFARRKWWGLATFAFVFGVVAAATLLMPKKYESHMKVLVKNERVDMVISAKPMGSSDYRNEVSESQINSEIELLNNENLLEQVVLKTGLDQKGSLPTGDPAEARLIAVEQAVQRLRRDLKISAARKASIIQIEYTADSPKLSASVLRALADLYLESHLKVHRSAGTYEFFSAQAARYEEELKDAEAKLDEFQQRESIVMLDEQQAKTLQKRLDAESELMQADALISEYTDRIADTRTKLSAVSARVVTQSRSVPNQYSVERLHTMLAELKNRRTQVLAKFRPEDRMVQEVDQEIADTEMALEEAAKLKGTEEAVDINPVYQALELELAKTGAALAGMEARREILAQQAGTYRTQLEKLGNATTPHSDLIRARKEAEENYLLYSRKAEESRISESLDQQKISNVVIAESPRESHVPVRPNIPMNLALGGILATILSLATVFITERFRSTIEGASELEELTGIPVLATTHRSYLPLSS